MVTLEATAPGTLPRCYDLAFGGWTIGNAAVELSEPVPKRIALMSQPFRARGDTLEYWAIAWPSESLHQFGIWQWVAADSIAVRFPSWGSWGLRLRLAERHDSTTGQAQVYGDFTPFKPAVAPITGPRIPCPELPAIGKAGA